MTKQFIFALLLNITSSLLCNAQDEDDVIVRFNPSGNLSIGKTIDINNPNATKQPALDRLNENSAVWLDGGSPNTSLKASLATNINELYEKLNIDYHLQGEVKIPVIGGGKSEFDIKYEIEKEYSDNNLYYVIQAYNDFGRQGLQEVKLKDNFQKLINQNKHNEFITAVGTHYVVRQRRASWIYALIKISKINSVTKKSLTAKYKNEVNVNIAKVADLSVQQSLDFKNFIKTSYKLGTVNIEYYSSGTGGLSKLANGFPQSPDDLNSILKAVSNAAESVVRENSTPVEYHLASFKPFGLNLPSFNENKSECLSNLTNKRLVVSSYLNKARKIVLDQTHSNFKTYYQKKVDELTKMIKIIDKYEKECKEKNICCQTDNNIEPFYLLEDIITIDKSYVIPDYVPVFKADGSDAGQMIKSLKLIVEGKVKNDEYYCCIDGYYLDANLDPIKTNIGVIGNTNPSLSDPEKKDNFFEREFVYIIDIANIDYQYNSNSKVIYNNINLDRSQAVIEKLRRNSYFIEVTSKDNLKNYFDIGTFNFNEIRSFIAGNVN